MKRNDCIGLAILLPVSPWTSFLLGHLSSLIHCPSLPVCSKILNRVFDLAFLNYFTIFFFDCPCGQQTYPAKGAKALIYISSILLILPFDAHNLNAAFYNGFILYEHFVIISKRLFVMDTTVTHFM